MQVHAYLLCPLALALLRPRTPGFRARLAAALAAAGVGGSLWRLHMAGTVDLRFPFSGVPGGEAADGQVGRWAEAGLHGDPQGIVGTAARRTGQSPHLGQVICLQALRQHSPLHTQAQALPGSCSGIPPPLPSPRFQMAPA